MIDAILKIEVTSWGAITFRLICAMIAGFAVGFERERHYQPAGLRTHMVLALGACIVMIISILVPIEFHQSFPSLDTTRIAAQAVSGIGFLGAGAIFRYGFTVKGLTTAASIWTTSAIGLAFGAGLYWVAVSGTILLIVILQIFEKVENLLVEQKDLRILTVEFKTGAMEIGDIVKVIKRHNVVVKQMSIADLIERGNVEVKINCRIDAETSIKSLFHDIKELGEIKVLRID
ncbi:MAG: MgtC/SapB family protein [Spirochaetes bacterium]|nr:MgtC/SapB family protein [Spirochaetota bacterium]